MSVGVCEHILSLKEQERAHLPDAQVEVITARHNVRGIARKSRAEHALHALGCVHFVTVATVVPKEADASVVRASNKLFPGWREVDVHDG